MFEVIRGIAGRFLALPSYGIAATSLFVLYAVQAEIRFGAKARATRGGPSDRFSTMALSLAMLVPVLGFILVMKGRIPRIRSNATAPIDLFAILVAWDHCYASTVSAWPRVIRSSW